MSQTNPFHQPEALWRVTLEVPAAAVAMAEDAFCDALTLSSFEVEDGACLASDAARWEDDLPIAERWKVEALWAERPDAGWLASIVALLDAQGLGEIGRPEVSPVERQDWIAAVQASHPPLVAGRFWVAGSHVTDRAPGGLMPLIIDAGLAFGSGEHATTRGCLIALSELSRRMPAARLLDMGCGSGILACAMAKLWHAPVMASDIDAVSVRVARETAVRNRLSAWLEAVESDGYRNPAIRRYGPYDVIAANILARPLARMAPHLAAHLAPGGRAVLSGLLDSQERFVLHAHRRHGLVLERRIAIGPWRTLVLRG